MAWSHQWDQIVGKGVIDVQKTQAVFRGRFFLDTEAGAEAYKTVKNMGALQDWSFGFRITEAEVKTVGGIDARVISGAETFEVSPVLGGANAETSTVAIKSDGDPPPDDEQVKSAIQPHGTATDTGSWAGPTMVARLKADQAAPYYRRAYAWQDPDGDPGTKAAYKFPHHFVTAEGEIGAASVRAAISGIAILNGGRGGADIPDDDRKGIYNHLARHLRDAEVDPPDLKSDTRRLVDHATALLVESISLATRVREVSELRARDGRGLGDQTKSGLELVRDELTTVIETIDTAMMEPASPDELQSLRARAIKDLSGAERQRGNDE